MFSRTPSLKSLFAAALALLVVCWPATMPLMQASAPMPHHHGHQAGHSGQKSEHCCDLCDVCCSAVSQAPPPLTIPVAITLAHRPVPVIAEETRPGSLLFPHLPFAQGPPALQA